jgi:alkylhydroperoxidase family enzyme
VAGSGDDKLVAAVLENWRTAPVSEARRSTLGFLEKLTTDPGAVGPPDLEPLRAAGVSDKAIEEAIYVCFLFSVMDRLADAFDFELHSAGDFKKGGQVLYTLGYSRLSIPG